MTATAAGAYEVVVPTYGVERTIAQTLTSLKAQSLPPARILVADDETPDASAEIAARFEGVEVMRFAHSGLSGVQNRALPHVNAGYVAFVDADDIWHPETGRILVNALEATDAALAAVGPAPFHDGEQPRMPKPNGVVWSTFSYDALLRRNVLPKSGTMYRTEALRAIGGWREDFPICGDHDVALRLLETGRQLYGAEWPGVGYRQSPASMLKQPAPALTEILRVTLPRLSDDDARTHSRLLWFRTLARAAHDGRDLRDVPALSTLISDPPRGQRVLESLVRSPARHPMAAGWRAWRRR